MEALEAIPEGVWNSLGGICASDEVNSISQLLGNCTFPSEIESCTAVHGVQTGSRPSYGSSFNLSITRGSASFSSENPVPYSSSYESYYFDDFSPVAARRDSSVPMDYCLNQYPREGATLQETRFQLDHLQYSQVNGGEFSPSGDRILSSGVAGKRSRISEDLHKITRTGRSKAARKLDFATNNEEEANVILSSSPCNSEDDSKGGVMTCSNFGPKGSTLCNVYLRQPSPNSKTRGSQGSASDPQSLYARKRREKINERLRILQNLVPNGTKVDISTMLEEAVHYVKFLQLQVKLLSSDELWMYAPVAYNGMDIGLDKAARRRQL